MSDPRQPRRMARPADPSRGTTTNPRALGSSREAEAAPVERRAGGYRDGNGGYRNGPGNRRRGGHGRGFLFVLVLAVLVLLGIITFGGPVLAGMAGGWARGLAEDNPETLRFPFVASAVKADLGDALTAPGSGDDTPVRFEVPTGATADQIGGALVEQGFLREQLPWDYLIVTGDLGSKLQAGTYSLNKRMSPQQLVDALQQAPIQTVRVALREGLRLEQITAYLQTLGLELDAADFYELASNPSAELRADYAFLSSLPEGRSLEGFLGSGTFEVFPDVTSEELLRMLLEQWARQVGEGPLADAKAADRDFYEVLTLASIVEREAAVEEERSLIAGVYANRLDPERWRGVLNADPTVFYAIDTVALRGMALTEWPGYAFWTLPGTRLADVQLPEDLRGYNSYRVKGLPPGPICTPTRASIEAALDPDTSQGYLYFVLIPDGTRTHAFARTFDEHRANLRKYGY